MSKWVEISKPWHQRGTARRVGSRRSRLVDAQAHDARVASSARRGTELREDLGVRW